MPPTRPRGPPAPPWDRARPYLTHSFLRTAAAAPPPHPTPDPPLSSFAPEAQDAVAADDVLSALLGVPGALVTARLSAPPPHASASPRVAFDFDAGDAGVGVREVAGRCLGLADDYVVVNEFVEETRVAGEAGGYVRQALGVGVGELLGDYRSFILRLEAGLRKGEVGLQRMLFLLQPSMRSMALLRKVVESVGEKTGGAAVDAAYAMAAAHVGSADARSVLSFVVGRGAAPVLDSVGLWMRRGVIDDRFREFFVEENPRFAREGTGTGGKAWELRYSVNKDNVPAFLEEFVERILRAGKYLNVLRESAAAKESVSRTVVGTAAMELDIVLEKEEHLVLTGDVLLSPDAARRIAAFVDRTYAFASERLIGHLRDEVDVLSRLRSIKRYFMLEQGDFLVHFLDAADDELSKSRADLSLTKLSTLLDLSVRTSVSAADPHQEDLKCTLFDSDLASQILSALGSGPAGPTTGKRGESIMRPAETPTATSQAAGMLTGFDTFSLDYSVSWPMNLILSSMEILKYQLLFRYLFHCKHVERELEGCWRSLAQVKASNRRLRSQFARTFALRHRMLQFLRTILYYMVSDVLEPNWQKFEASYEGATTIDEIMVHHVAFLDASLSQCLLSSERHLRVFHSVTKICLLFANFTETFTANLTNGTSVEQITAVMVDRNYAVTIGKFEKSFDSNLQQVLEGLLTMSKKRASTHLANLCDALDFGGYYKRSALRAEANMEL